MLASAFSFKEFMNMDVNFRGFSSSDDDDVRSPGPKRRRKNSGVSYVQMFRDEKDLSAEDEDVCSPVPKRRRSNRIWLLRETFNSSKEAEDAVQARKIWKKSASSRTTAGLRVEYRCTAAKYRINECPAAVYLLYHSENTTVSLYETTDCHANHIDDPARGLSKEMKTFVEDLYRNKVTKPNAILDVMRQRKMTEPPKSKLVSFLATLRVEKYGQPTVSASDIRTWCAGRSYIPDDIDEPYVIRFDVHAESNDVNEQELKIVFSTRRLLSLCTKSVLVQTDATYKLVWQGYPVLLVGTSDAAKKFHPYAAAVTKGETAQDFEFLFRALHEVNLEWAPSILLADGSEAITNGFHAVFGPPDVRLMCNFHVIKNVEPYLKSLTKNGIAGHLKEDIYTLQICPDETTFTSAFAMFLEKWQKKKHSRVNNFLEYFEKEWFQKYPNWYEGAAPGHPSTNNGVESTNAAIKRENTLRERLPVGQFLTCMAEMVEQWSRRRDPSSINCVTFAETPIPSLQLWTEAFQWAISPSAALQRDTEDGTEYFVSSSRVKEVVTPKTLRRYEKREGRWVNFDDFKSWRTEIWKITVSPAGLACSCPSFLKNGQCKHALGIQIRQREVVVPPEAKTVPLGQKRKRGRPKKALKALLIQ